MKKVSFKTTKNIFLKSITILLTIGFFTTSCSKKDNPVPVVVDTKLALPASLENNTLLTVPDATQNTSACGSGAEPGIAESTIVIDKEGIIGDGTKVSVELDLSDEYAGEVVVELITPSGATCGLIKRIGTTTNTNCGSNIDFVAGNKLTFNFGFNNVVLNNPIATGNYGQLAGTSTFPSTVQITSLNTFFSGKNIKGNWKLKVYDTSVGDLCKLNAWKLKFDTGALQ
jgi:subtilisin-like proprotein convertase family protein